MDSVLENTLYEKHNKSFEELGDKSKQFLAAYCGNIIIRDNIFSVIKNYARKREIDLEIMRYPFQDEELWAFTFLKNGHIFVCINSELAMCKQIFAAAHELYHIHCYAEDEDQNIIRNVSMLDSDTADEIGKTMEDLEANAFAGLLLMPEQLLNEQISLYGIKREKPEFDDVLILRNAPVVINSKVNNLKVIKGDRMFIVREKENTDLNEMYVQERFQLFVLYGCRRVGKTTLLNEFCKDKPAIFYSAEQSNDKLNLEKFSAQVFQFYGETTLEPFSPWETPLLYINSRQSDRRLILAFDEFPYLVRKNRARLSTLQHLIDHTLQFGKSGFTKAVLNEAANNKDIVLVDIKELMEHCDSHVSNDTDFVEMIS